jgi:hypothetical protein
MMSKLKVPYYAQSADFTCGPACVVMVRKYFEPNLRMGRDLEFEVWRQCNMLGVSGADPYGLSVPLIDAGYEVRLISQRRQAIDSSQWKRRLKRHFSQEEVELSLFGMKQNRRRALKRHLNITFRRPVVDDILAGLHDDFVPIALVHMGVIHSLNIPHWVVVTDADQENVRFNDPYPPKGRKGIRLSHSKFQKILDDIGTRIGLSPSILFVQRK